ncbi:MFS transporter [Desertibaculum subflavum]|uniref:MFS transporter n=1 Tax=Desertibaculum subflavum TaxID=2268458 RepID=UPI000E66C316
MSVATARGGVFYGWIVVAAAAAVLLVVFGMAYSFAAFFPALAAEFGATRGDTSLVFALAGFLYFGIGGISGAMADRFGPRPIVVAGILLVAVALALTGLAAKLWQVYALYGLGLGIGIGLAYVPAIGAVQRWFVRQRGLASGIAVSGIGVGTLLAPPVASALIEAYGWRGAYLGLAVIAAVVGLGAALLIEANPAARGLGPDGDPPLPHAAAMAAGPSLRDALATLAFRRLYLSAVLVSFSIFIPFVHLAAYARDAGHGEAVAVWLVGLIGLGSLGGRFLVGFLADRLGRKPAMALCFLGIAAMMLLWWSTTAIALLAVFALVFGSCYGGFVALAPALAADHFAGRSITAIIGVYYSAVAFGTLLGPTLAGYAYDFAGSYDLPILASAALSLAGAAVVMRLPARRA